MINLNLGCGIEVIKRKSWENLDAAVHCDGVIQHDIQTPLPYSDNSVDKIVTSHVLEHLSEPEKAVADWYRVLKPGGTMILCVPDGERKLEWIGYHAVALIQRDNAPLERHHTDFDEVDLRLLMQSVGEWKSIERGDPTRIWELPGKASWQLVLVGIKSESEVAS